MNVDLHTHTTASDGKCSPRALLELAIDNQVNLLAITDHDTVEGYRQVCQCPLPPSLRLISGVEFSTYWGKVGIHIVGLGMDVDQPRLKKLLADQRGARTARAKYLGEALAAAGVAQAYQGACREGQTQAPTRAHFAQYLVSKGYARNRTKAFKKYLGDHRVRQTLKFWAPMAATIDAIDAAGGIAVLAHPAKYGLTRTKVSKLLEAFKADGGRGVEVISGRQTTEITDSIATLAKANDLLGSVGSDFHLPDQPWAMLGKTPGLPKDITPVWECI
ncbi:MAG: PHP domain-containing protein [Pseudomonadota bacterium]